MQLTRNFNIINIRVCQYFYIEFVRNEIILNLRGSKLRNRKISLRKFQKFKDTFKVNSKLKKKKILNIFKKKLNIYILKINIYILKKYIYF